MQLDGTVAPFESTRSVTYVGAPRKPSPSDAGSEAKTTTNREASIELTPEGAFLKDLGSVHGILLNGQPLRGRMSIKSGDEIRLHNGIMHVMEIELPPKAVASLDERVEELSLPESLPEIKMPAQFHSRRSSSRRVESGPGYFVQARDFVSNHKSLSIGGAGLLLGAIITGIVVWLSSGSRRSGSDSPAVLGPEEVYRQQLHSSAYIEVGGGSGSGCLIDRERKLVLTAYHVIASGGQILVVFPKFKDGKPVSQFTDYDKSEVYPAKIWKSDPAKDLAILELDKVPDHIRVLPIAASSPEPGEEVYTVGGKPAGSQGLWIPTKGNVREVQRKNFSLKSGQAIDAWVVATTNPVNPGDSGGALVNKKCELVGVCCASDERVTLVRDFIDLREVRQMLNPTSSVPATTKSQTATIVGTWKVTRGDPMGGVIEFTSSGKVVVHGMSGGKSKSQEIGSYRVEGDKLVLLAMKDGKADNETETIKSLTANRMILVDTANMETEFERVK